MRERNFPTDCQRAISIRTSLSGLPEKVKESLGLELKIRDLQADLTQERERLGWMVKRRAWVSKHKEKQWLNYSPAVKDGHSLSIEIIDNDIRAAIDEAMGGR